MSHAQKASARTSIRRHTLLGLSAALFLVGGLGGWAVVTELSGAVVAPGAVVVDSHVKKVQHPTGGVVGEIHARDGDRVRAGDIVIRLDETVARANLAMVSKSLDELAARQGRLESERDGARDITFPAALRSRLDETDIVELTRSETRVFESRREAREGQKAQLKERIAQLQEQIDGLDLQAAAKADEIQLIQSELSGVEQLWRKNLVPITRVTALKREETRLRGERGQLISNIAQSKGRISETALQILQIEQDLKSEVSKELREVQAKIAELVERRVAAEDQLKRIDIRAPQDGFVHQSMVHTVGGVINAGEPLMMIVPESDELSIEVKVSPQDIDQLRPGLDTVLRLSAFNQRTTPEIKGRVSLIAADLVTDQRSGIQYYPVRVAFADGERDRLGALKLMPGMPVEGFIQTGYRTVFSYLTKPIADNMAKAFREE
ncbi:HlyD family type I secretion periplasmic adaptor subunit [Microvirga lotononidis]|uniref:Membrane fusion protein (MFP) family protein n=1 Tax=Microvirga lotononidis TaxID=864069 RepID=I4YLF7_9HYPH|nr:HlyD family type I secretion periplasmic adaptor subunit [Microvirga lotononidis]EIM24799.1 type I secretion membrane fusion protein, HlyD family [Microvirga lotononidis]WQO29696.1 HlyD family type I secretion periplasmic adaptor subunit [Microvirga lotononidis]